MPLPASPGTQFFLLFRWALQALLHAVLLYPMIQGFTMAQTFPCHSLLVVQGWLAQLANPALAFWGCNRKALLALRLEVPAAPTGLDLAAQTLA